MHTPVLTSLFYTLFITTSAASQQTLKTGQGTATVRPGTCKSIPGEAGWPAEQDWAILNQQVKGRLLKPIPPAAGCHKTEYLSVARQSCALISLGFKDSQWHAKNPVSNMWQNWNNYSCMPSPNGGSCSTSGYPVYVVEAREASDVKAAVDFARTRNIRLNIKSTGHDFLGRSVQPYSLSIWTRNLNKQRWIGSSFTPKGCSFSIPGASVTAGAGTQWQFITAMASLKRLMVVSGAFPTVSLGGFLSNGGHGGLSAKYGLGADMVQEIELVTPMGDIITANECQNQDYFWAMRGGGGSTYGVALSYNLHALPTVRSSMFMTSLKGWDQLAYWYRNWPKVAMVGGSGYFKGYPGANWTVEVGFVVPNMTQTNLQRLMNPIMKGLRTMRRDESRARRKTRGGAKGARKAAQTGTAQRNADLSEDAVEGFEPMGRSELDDTEDLGAYATHETWADAQTAIESRQVEREAMPYPGEGKNCLIASWLWSEADLKHPRLRDVLEKAFDPTGEMVNDATMGVGTHNPPYIRGGGNAVNPAFRTAVMRPATELVWNGADLDMLESKSQDALRFTQSYASIAPQGGTYANEAYPGIPNWQHAFWGDNYPRLLEIKKRVDPLGVFYCRKCVGSELWNDSAGKLCKL